MNRRTFLQLSAGLPAAAALRPKTRHRTSPWGIERIGIQLYTVRSVLADDFEGTIRAVAGLGYQELDMTAPAGHIGIEALRGDLAGVIDTFLAMGHRYVVCPYLDANERTLEHYRQHAALFNEVGVACSEAGLQFAYHNHEFEFVETDGIVPYDLLLAETDPELVWMELDLFWVEAAQVSSVDLFTRAPGRFPLCHIKDMGPDAAMVAVGEGDIDFASILAHSEHAGLRHYFVEHDHPEDPMQSIATSIAHLQSLEF